MKKKDLRKQLAKKRSQHQRDENKLTGIARVQSEDDLNDVLDRLSSENFAAGYSKALDDSTAVSRDLDEPIMKWFAALSSLEAIVMCDNGPRTRATAQAHLNDFVGTMQGLHIAMKKALQIAGQSDMNGLPEAIADYCAELRARVDDWLTRGNDQSQMIVRELIGSQHESGMELWRAIAGLRERGRQSGHTPESLYLGEQLRAAKKKHPRKAGWQLALDLVRDLVRLPEDERMPEQKAALEALSLYFIGQLELDSRGETTFFVDPDQQRKLSKQVSKWIKVSP